MAVCSFVSGYCPELHQQMEIQVYFTETRMMGMSKPNYQKSSYLCEFSAENDCRTAGSNQDDCPLYKTAKY